VVGRARANLSSADRQAAWHAVWHQIALHPIAGAGPGLRQLSWRAPDGSLRVFAYAHDEYLQLFAELGLIGLICLIGCAISLVRLLVRARPAARYRRALGYRWTAVGYRWALGIAAVLCTAVSVAFDFTGHFPAITLTTAVLVGCAVGPATAAWPAMPAGAATADAAGRTELSEAANDLSGTANDLSQQRFPR
jgi:O-antigen ligase